MKIEKLEWDSNFFSLNIYKLNELIQQDENFQNKLEKFVFENNVDLIYFESDYLIENLFIDFKSLKAYLVDTKTTFSKTAAYNAFDQKLIKKTSEIEVDKYEDKIIKLALQSAQYSRFKVDKNFSEDDYKKLYKEWIINSINKKIAKEILFYQIEDDIAGLITLGVKSNIGDIGIVAVEDKYRGQGIAKKMLFATENWFFENNLKTINVVTQGDNLPAKALYKSCGYKIIKRKFFYHLWKI